MFCIPYILLRMVQIPLVYEKGEESDPHLLHESAAGAGLSLKREKRVSLIASGGLLFSVFVAKEQLPTKGQKETPPHLLHAQQPLFDCGQCRKHSGAKSSTEASPSHLFPGGVC